MNLRNLKQELERAWDEHTHSPFYMVDFFKLRNELRNHGTLFGVAIPTETADPGPLREWIPFIDTEDIGALCLVKTEKGDVVTAQQLPSIPRTWVIYIPGRSMFFQPTLDEKVTHYIRIGAIRTALGEKE